MQPKHKLTIGDRVITTRNDGEIGTVCGFRTWHRKEQANVVFEIGEDKWIGVDYLTIEVTTIEQSDSPADDFRSELPS
jgi:hypothetical protein